MDAGWSVDESGQPVMKRADGAQVYKDGAPITMEGWAVELAKEAPHFFKISGGGGASTVPGGTTNGAVRSISLSARLTPRDVEDIAKGTAIRDGALA
jgi:hypothetical protein